METAAMNIQNFILINLLLILFLHKIILSVILPVLLEQMGGRKSLGKAVILKV